MKFFKCLISLIAVGIGCLTTMAMDVPTPRNYDTEGKSGVIRVYSTDRSNSLRIGMDQIVERNSQNRPVQKIENLAEQTYTWSPVVHKIINGYNVSETTLNCALNNGASFGLIVHASEREFVANYGNTTVTVPRWAVKWSAIIRSWPWLNQQNTLELRMFVKTKKQEDRERRGKGDQPDDDETNEKTEGRRECVSRRPGKCNLMNIPGNGLLVAENNAIVDNTTMVTINSTIVQDGEKTYTIFSFPYFQTSILYDPVMSASTYIQEQESYASTFHISYSLLGAVLLLLL